MARTATRRTSGARTAAGTAAKRPGAALAQMPSHEDVARRAYEIYLARGGRDGSPFDDWVEAERQLTQRSA